MKGSSEKWMFTTVYGLVRSNEKPFLWEELDDIGRAQDLPWLIGGDFNVFKKRTERSSGKVTKFERESFLNFMDDHSLLEFDRSGPNYTYTNGQVNRTMSRLDRFLVNLTWLEIFHDHVEHVKAFHSSDHRMLVLTDSTIDHSPKPFCFQNYWLNDNSLLSLMKGWWLEEQVQGKPGFIQWKKLKLLKVKVKRLGEK